jgi:2'-5' RNA ligase
MGNLVIVAIPEEQDRVWKISSEKVPHLTLLFLGDEANADTQQIVQFVEHAVTLAEHGPFYLDVERRGTLGPDEADVLFFSKRSWNLKWIRQFRGQLLQNQAVKTAFDSTQQYDEWTPHLTMGYPTSPAKEDKENYPFYSVCFDRIAVWDQDYAGPEFQLEWPDRELEGDLAIAYSDYQKHALMHGTKLGPKPKTAAELGEEFIGQISDTEDVSADSAVERGKEFVAHQSVLDNATLAEQIKAKVQSILDDVTGDPDGDVGLFGDPLIRTKIQSVLQDFYKDPNVDNQVVYDALGQAFIEHYGVKGMHWGVRKDQTATRLSTTTGHSLVRGKAKIKVEGGDHHKAHPDAVRVAKAKQKLKKSGTNALSNQELRDVANRVQLENQVHLLTSHKGRKYVGKILESEGQNLLRTGIREGVRRGVKRAGATAAVAALA